MKRDYLSIAFVVFSAFIAIELAKAEQTLHFVTDDEFPPYSWLVGGKAVGIDVDMVRELCSRIEEKCTIEPRPWKRALVEVEQGTVDGLFSAFVTPEREQFSYVTKYPIHYSTHYIFVKKGNEFQFQTISDLYGKRIGKYLGFFISNEFDKAVSEGRITIYEVGTAKTNIARLMLDRVDGVIANYHETLFSLRDSDARQIITYLPYPILKSRGAYLMISKKSTNIADKPQLVHRINNALESMYNDGVAEEINKKYVGQ